MTGLDRRVVLLERRVPERVTPEQRASRESLRRLSLAELEALEAAVVAREAGRPLTCHEEAALDAWERATASITTREGSS
jgi:hypothetical protein